MIEIIDYKSEYQEYFKTLNLEWIQKYFTVEPTDEYVLSNPQKAILDNGGFIFFAKSASEIVGTCALQKVDDKTYELAKMAVNKKHQGLGIGRMLMDKAIQQVIEMKIDKLVLYSSTHLSTALNMYFKYGFRFVPKDNHPTSRANIKMELKIGKKQVELFRDPITTKPKTDISIIGVKAYPVQFQIRKATSEDLPAVLKLYGQKDIDNGDVLGLKEAKDIFSKFMLYPNYSLYVAEITGKVVGTFELLVMDNLAHKGQPSGVVEDVIIDAEFRSQGIGRQMMEYAIDVCRKNGCYKMTLSSNLKRERAHQFYENLGFEKHGYSFLIEL